MTASRRSFHCSPRERDRLDRRRLRNNAAGHHPRQLGQWEVQSREGRPCSSSARSGDHRSRRRVTVALRARVSRVGAARSTWPRSDSAVACRLITCGEPGLHRYFTFERDLERQFREACLEAPRAVDVSESWHPAHYAPERHRGRANFSQAGNERCSRPGNVGTCLQRRWWKSRG